VVVTWKGRRGGLRNGLSNMIDYLGGDSNLNRGTFKNELSYCHLSICRP